MSIVKDKTIKWYPVFEVSNWDLLLTEKWTKLNKKWVFDEEATITSGFPHWKQTKEDIYSIFERAIEEKEKEEKANPTVAYVRPK